uniref:Myosin heavy chain 3 n=1 Tax=Sus scrofa TaxID=9823 RepID=A0A1Y0EX02_PIG
MVVHESEE